MELLLANNEMASCGLKEHQMHFMHIQLMRQEGEEVKEEDETTTDTRYEKIDRNYRAHLYGRTTSIFLSTNCRRIVSHQPTYEFTTLFFSLKIH